MKGDVTRERLSLKVHYENQNCYKIICLCQRSVAHKNYNIFNLHIVKSKLLFFSSYMLLFYVRIVLQNEFETIL